MATDLFHYLIKAGICQSICYLIYWLLLRRETCFSFNRGYLLIVLVLSVAIPMVEIPVESTIISLPRQSPATSYTVAAAQAAQPAAVQPVAEVAPAASAALSLQEVLWYGYLAVCLLMALRLLYQAGVLFYIKLTGRVHLYHNYRLIYTGGKLPTSSFFGWLFWDNTRVLPAEEKDLIIRHELAHITQQHSWDNLFLQLVKIFFWFSPAIYLLEKALQQVHEYQADRGVVNKANTARYTQLLIEQSFAGLDISLLHTFSNSHIGRRIAMIKADLRQRTPAFWKMGLSIALAAGICYLQACQPKEVTEPDLAQELNAESTYWFPKDGVSWQAGQGTVVKSNRFKEGEYLYGHYPKPDVDEYAYPVGGFNPFHTYIQNNLREPEKIKPAGIVKKVFVQFTVDTEGNIRNPRVMPGMGLGSKFDEEAIRVIANGPKWVPAKKNGKPVEASMMEVIRFGEREALIRFANILNKAPDKSIVKSEPLEGSTLGLTRKFTLNYPEEAKRQFIEGTVVIGFTVQADGKATGFEVLQPIHPALDREALRVAQAANVPWKPAMKDGKAHTSKALIVFGFYLAD